MLVTADWVLPIGRAPIRNGGVLVTGSSIVEVGPAEDLERRGLRGPTHNFPGCAITPGLVNAHTHLAMTCLKDVVGPMPFHEWIARIPVAFRALSDDDIAASIAYGAHRVVASGTTVVGDIAYGPESLAICADSGLAGTFFWEVLGLTPHELAHHLFELEYPADPATGCSERYRCGLSPHATYSSGPELLQAAHKIATAQGVGFAIHLAESAAETELMRTGAGPLAGVARRLAHGFVPPDTSPVAYLDGLGVLESAIAVHAVRVLPTDIPRLSRLGTRIILCPRSNEYLHNGTPPAWRFEHSAIPLALGTDSLASNSDLDLFEEARALRAIEPRFDAHRLIEMMTSGGARVLGMQGSFGELSPGMQADLAAFRIPDASDPYEALLASGGRHAVEAVLSAGVWRVLGGAATMGISVIERASHLAGQRAALALALDSDHS